MLTTTVAGHANPAIATFAIPAGLAAGALIGLVNGLGVAFLRLPSMVWTLAMNSMLVGTIVFFTGGFKPRGVAPPLSVTLSLERSLGIPNAFLLLAGGHRLRAVAHPRRTMLRQLYLIAIGNSEKAVYLLRCAGAADHDHDLRRPPACSPAIGAILLGRLCQPGLSGHGRSLYRCPSSPLS
ncbi:MAG: hypothetical protein QM711_12830 [Micropruina sp.]|uniref:ABC transporter permease subunit n=1 Tax=Micropruina sp. TaxID=2737536 RepID=UPI0039E511EC